MIPPGPVDRSGVFFPLAHELPVAVSKQKLKAGQILVMCFDPFWRVSGETRKPLISAETQGLLLRYLDSNQEQMSRNPRPP